MKYLSTLMLLVLLAGCRSTPSTRSVPWLGSLFDTAPEAAATATWPFEYAGFLCIIAGVGYWLFLKDGKLLAAGVGLALIPVLLHYVLPSLVPIVAVVAVLAGLLMLFFLGRRLYKANTGRSPDVGITDRPTGGAGKPSHRWWHYLGLGRNQVSDQGDQHEADDL